MPTDTTSTAPRLRTTIGDLWTMEGFSNWKDTAADLRREWMRMMGHDIADIEQDILDNPPYDIDVELAEYNAMFRIQRMH